MELISYLVVFAAGAAAGVLVTLNNTRRVAQLVARLEELARELADRA